MKATVLDVIPVLPGIFYVSAYDTKPVHLLSICCNTIKWIQKTRKVYDPETQMIHDAQLLFLNFNDSYNG